MPWGGDEPQIRVYTTSGGTAITSSCTFYTSNDVAVSTMGMGGDYVAFKGGDIAYFIYDNTTYTYSAPFVNSAQYTVYLDQLSPPEPTFLDDTGLATLAGLIKTSLSGKEDILISGTSIKTVNNVSVLGSGDLTIAGSDPDAISNSEIDDMWDTEAGHPGNYIIVGQMNGGYEDPIIELGDDWDVSDLTNNPPTIYTMENDVQTEFVYDTIYLHGVNLAAEKIVIEESGPISMSFLSIVTVYTAASPETYSYNAGLPVN